MNNFMKSATAYGNKMMGQMGVDGQGQARPPQAQVTPASLHTTLSGLKQRPRASLPVACPQQDHAGSPQLRVGSGRALAGQLRA